MKKPEHPPSRSISDEEGKMILDLLSNPEEIEDVYKVEVDYPYWDKFKVKTKDHKFESRLLWKFMKLNRNRSISRLQISKVNGFDFVYNTPRNVQEWLHQFDLNLGGTLEGKSIVPEKEKERYLISSLMEEAIASSQLEGAVTTREVAKNMLRESRKPKNHSERMILNNYLTIREILKYQDQKLTPELILRLHEIVTRETLDDANNEGRFRTNNDVKVVDHITGEVFYTPPDCIHLDQLMNDFCYFANAEGSQEFIHPIIRGIILHFLIGYIHPFVDGNGRLARTIFYWYLIKKGYWLIEFMSISRIIIRSPSQYARAYLFTEYDGNDLTYFIDFNLKSMDLALKSLKEYIKRKQQEKHQLFELIKSGNFNERQAEVIKQVLIKGDQSLTFNEIQSKFGITYQTARTDLLDLEVKGYLISKAIGKKFRFYKSDQFEEKIKSIGNLAS